MNGINEINGINGINQMSNNNRLYSAEDCLFHVPLEAGIDAACAHGDPKWNLCQGGNRPETVDDGIRRGARFGRDTCVLYRVDRNFRREEGTVMLWFKPDWNADFEDNLGRILWDLRIDCGSVVEDDPSQRWAIVYPNPAGKGKPGGR